MEDKSVTKEMLLDAGYEKHEKSSGYVRELGEGKRFHFIPLHLTYPLEEGFHIHIDRLNYYSYNHMSHETKETKKAIQLELRRIRAVSKKNK
jgi:hypothetical protein